MIQATTAALILGAVTLSALGQLCMKSGAERLDGFGRFAFFIAAARDPFVLSGLAAWAASTLCWLYVLRVTPLSRAYGFTSLTYVLVPLASACVFGEQIHRPQSIGIVLIIIGIACVLSAD